jgi:hypothetical protein
MNIIFSGHFRTIIASKMGILFFNLKVIISFLRYTVILVFLFSVVPGQAYIKSDHNNETNTFQSDSLLQPMVYNNEFFFGQLRNLVKQRKYIDGTNTFFTLYPNEIYSFKKKGERTFLQFDSVEIEIIDPNKTIKYLRYNSVFENLLGVYKSIVVNNSSASSGFRINLAPITDLNIFPDFVDVFDNNTSMRLMQTAIFKDTVFHSESSSKSFRIVIKGFPTLCYVLPGIRKERFIISNIIYENYLFNYCTHYGMFGRNASPGRIKSISKETFGVTLDEESYNGLAAQLGFTDIGLLSNITFLVILGIFVIISIVLLFFIYSNRNISGTLKSENINDKVTKSYLI